MKRYLFFGSLKDENKPIYICPVCSHIGFAYEHIDGRPDKHFELCRICGFDGGSKLNKDKWYQAWEKSGSEILFDKPYEERCKYLDEIQIAYLRIDYYIPTDQEIIEKNIDERAYLQNGFQHIIDSRRTVVVECNDTVSIFPYETNQIIELNDTGAYISICEKDNQHYLFLSKHFCYNNCVIRSSYIGLTPEVFSFSMLIEKKCVVDDYLSNSYRIWVNE